MHVLSYYFRYGLECEARAQHSSLPGVASSCTDGQGGNPLDHYAVRAGLAVLEQQYKIAETIYLEQVG